MKRLRRRTLLALLATVIGLAVSCNQIDSQQPAEIRIGVLATLTGEAAGVGTSTIDGAALAIADMQASGGLQLNDLPQRVTLVIEDDQDQVDAALNATRKLIYQDNVVAIIGPQFSRNAIPVAQLAEAAQVPMISPRATNPEVTQDKTYVFRTIFVDPFQGQVMADFARQDLKAETAAILFDIASAYNRGIAEVFKQQFETAGGQVVAYESYTTGETDFIPQLTLIRDSQPDVLFLPNYEFEVATQIKQAAELGVTSTLLGSDAWGSIPAADRLPLAGAYFSDQFAPDADTPNAQAFIQRFQQQHNKRPTAVAASTYDAVMLVLEAIQLEEEATPAAIRRGLANIDQFQGVTGTIKYQNTGDPIRSVVILQVQGDQFVFHKQVDP